MLIALLIQTTLSIDPTEARRLCPVAADVTACMAARQARADAIVAVRECRKATSSGQDPWLVEAKEVNRRCREAHYRCLGAYFFSIAAGSSNPDPAYSDDQIANIYRVARAECQFDWRGAGY